MSSPTFRIGLLDWAPEQLAFTLREDDFLFIKLGGLNPKCEPLRFSPPDDRARKAEARIARIIREEFPGGVGTTDEPLFDFVSQLSKTPRVIAHASRTSRQAAG